MKALRSLVRLHKLRVDEKRKHLAALENRRAAILADQAQLERELQSEKEIARGSLDAGTTFTAYLKGYEFRRARIVELLAEIEAQIEEAAQALSEAFQELKRYETAQANRERRARAELERRQTIEQDEIGIGMHRRSSKVV